MAMALDGTDDRPRHEKFQYSSVGLYAQAKQLTRQARGVLNDRLRFLLSLRGLLGASPLKWRTRASS